MAELNQWRDRAYAIAEEHGFHKGKNFGEKIALIHSELSEALEADRNKSWAKNSVRYLMEVWNGMHPMIDGVKEKYEKCIKGSVEEEIADALIRLFDLAGIYGVDLDWHVAAKMAYNKTRPYKHEKSF